MEEKRASQRIPLDLHAAYVFTDGTRESCKLINIGRTGAGIVLCAENKLKIDMSVRLEIDFPPRAQPIIADVYLLWIKEMQEKSPFNYVAGGLLTIHQPEDELVLLSYAGNCTADGTGGQRRAAVH